MLSNGLVISFLLSIFLDSSVLKSIQYILASGTNTFKYLVLILSFKSFLFIRYLFNNL